MHIRIVIIGLLAASTTVGGCSNETTPQSVPMLVNEQPISGGEVEEELTAVVGLTVASASICSGTLIAPNLVLTAQHCVAQTDSQVFCGVADFGRQYAPGLLLVTPSTRLFNTRDYYSVTEIVVPPDTLDLCGFDVALLILEESIPPEEALWMIPRIDIPIGEGEEYSAVGYGHVGDNSGAGVRRRLDGLEVQCVGADCPFWSFTEASEWIGGSGVCQGDSGGPALDVDNQVIGVVSRGPQGCGDTTYGSVYAWADWIRETALRAADEGDYEAPAWAVLGDSDPSLVDADDDGVRDELDNCPELANEDQLDADENGVGDDCQEEPESRGGDCTTCDECETEADCGGGICVRVDDGTFGFCTLPCNPSNSVCAGNTTCTAIQNAAGDTLTACVNQGFETVGICETSFVCDSTFVAPSPDAGSEGSAEIVDDEADEGCTATPGGNPSSAWLLIGAALVAQLRRRRIVVR
jgi:MYXO-CTERM domain-containing protein